MDTLVFVYGKDKNLITIREILVERNDVPNEMKKIAKEFKKASFLRAENYMDRINYNIKKKEFTFNYQD